MRRWLAVLGVVSLGAMAACVVTREEDDDVEDDSARVTGRPFDRNDVLEDAVMTDGDAMSATAIQAFLEKSPYGARSVLADHTENGKKASEIVQAAAAKHGVHPLVLLVRAQLERELVEKTTAPAAAIASAFGCGAAGFATQADCAAQSLRRSMQEAKTEKGTALGYRVKAEQKTEDGFAVTPQNAATAALYTYTPYVGKEGGGREDKAGVSGHHFVWTQFAEAAGYKGPGGGAQKPPGTDSGAPDGESADSSVEADGGDAGSNAGPTPPPSDDGVGNDPPSSHGPPKKRIASEPEDLPLASEQELASTKKKTSGGCSTAAGRGAASPWLALVTASMLAAFRRRRRAA